MDDIVFALASRISQLKTLSLVENAESPELSEAVETVSSEMSDIEASVSALRAALDAEERAVAEMEQIAAQMEALGVRAAAMKPDLPAQLPGVSLAEAHEMVAAEDAQANSSSVSSTETPDENTEDNDASSASTDGSSRRKQQAKSATSAKRTVALGVSRPIVKMDYVTVDEFAQVPQYIRGRLQRDVVNTLIDRVHEILVDKQKILTTPRAHMSETKMKKYRAFKDAEIDEVRGYLFVVEENLRTVGVRLDSTGRSAITVLRHLHRIKEVRGKGLVRYVVIEKDKK